MGAACARPALPRSVSGFCPVTIRAVRVVNNSTADNYWTIAEMRVFSQGKEVPRAADWRMRAWPNGAEVQLAFDNNYATRWSTWQAITPHDRIEVAFGAPGR